MNSLLMNQPLFLELGTTMTKISCLLTKAKIILAASIPNRTSQQVSSEALVNLQLNQTIKVIHYQIPIATH